MFVGQMVHSEIPTVLCGACGKGICFPIVNQVCSANCGAYVCEVVAEGALFHGRTENLPTDDDEQQELQG